MAQNVPIIVQNDGTKLPAFGLGTYTSNGGDCERSIKDAIDAGYRHFDTAYFYENEAEVGKAIRDKIEEGVIKREDVYIVSKLWSNFHETDKVEYAIRKSLKNFGLDYVDLYLMHWPYAYVYRGDDVFLPTDASGNVEMSDIDYVDTWKAMEKLVGLGLTKSIGVSNFNHEQLERLISSTTIKPIHNQIECHPALSQTKLIEYCKERNIVVTAYCPLGRPDPSTKSPIYLFDGKVKAIGDKYNKSAAQVVLRYLYEIGTVPIPKSVTKERIQQNIEIFDFQLDAADREILKSYHTGERCFPMEHAKNNKNYPFSLEY